MRFGEKLIRMKIKSIIMNAGKVIGWVGIVLMLAFATAATQNFLIGSFNTDDDKVNNVPDKFNGEVQRVDLTVKDYNYYPQVINLKYNVPTEIIVDASKVKGCFQSIVIPDFNVRKYVRPGDNAIKFVPDKKGTFSYSCSMGMGYGKIVVN